MKPAFVTSTLATFEAATTSSATPVSSVLAASETAATSFALALVVQRIQIINCSFAISSGLCAICGFTDSDYANSTEDKRRSMSGYCFYVFGCLVSWKSKLQPITA